MIIKLEKLLLITLSACFIFTCGLCAGAFICSAEPAEAENGVSIVDRKVDVDTLEIDIPEPNKTGTVTDYYLDGTVEHQRGPQRIISIVNDGKNGEPIVINTYPDPKYIE